MFLQHRDLEDESEQVPWSPESDRETHQDREEEDRDLDEDTDFADDPDYPDNEEETED